MSQDYVYDPVPTRLPDPLGMTGMLRTLARCARSSPDPSTQNAAGVAREIWSPWASVHAFFNSPIRGLPFTDRDEKMAVTEHAEERVCSVVHGQEVHDMVALWAACPDCARDVVRAGFKRVWTLDLPCPDRWKKSVDLGRKLLADCGVHVIFVRPQFELGESWLLDGKQVTV